MRSEVCKTRKLSARLPTEAQVLKQTVVSTCSAAAISVVVSDDVQEK